MMYSTESGWARCSTGTSRTMLRTFAKGVPKSNGLKSRVSATLTTAPILAS